MQNRSALLKNKRHSIELLKKPNSINVHRATNETEEQDAPLFNRRTMYFYILLKQKHTLQPSLRQVYLVDTA